MLPEKAYRTCPDGSVVIMLVHQPNAAKRIIDTAKRQIDLILSGIFFNFIRLKCISSRIYIISFNSKGRGFNQK